ncbi:hypothetical protein BD408DRAFT_409760 [Parasitella parasitica]|nr:hypothetical protein BD408DRAFT_409760 [Parasitella parasitica]
MALSISGSTRKSCLAKNMIVLCLAFVRSLLYSTISFSNFSWICSRFSRRLL